MAERGPWRTGERLGAGAMGVVYAATHAWLHTPAALKVLAGAPSERALRRFRDEMRAVAALDHPNVIDVYDIGDDWFVVERLGATLREAAPRDWEGVRTALLALLAALGHAHAHTVVHCDLKPDNVLLAADGQPVLADFGLALLRADRRSGAAGTPLYMAPEQYRGRDLGPWTDLYALGVTAWELVCGDTPFQATSPARLQQAHLTEEPPPLRPAMTVPDGLEDWLATLLEKEPGARFPTAAHAAVALRALGPAVREAEGPRSAHAPASTWATETWDPDAPEAAPPRSQRVVFPAPALPADWRAPPPRAPHASLSLFGLRAPRWVGREAEAERVWGVLRAACADGRPRGVVVTGPPGIGSSRLVAELAGRAVESGAMRGARLEDLSGLDSDDRPVVVVGDDPTADAVAVASKLVASGHPAVVLLVGQVAPPRGFEAVELAPLDDSDQGALVASLAPFDPAAVRRIVELTAGNPQLAVQLVGDALARGAVAPSEQGLTIEGALDLPAEARSAWSARLAAEWEGIPDAERAATLVGALLGRGVDEERWAEACRLVGAAVPGVGLERLVVRGLVQRRLDRLRFAHEGLRRAIAEAASAEDLRNAHAACAAVSAEPVARAAHLLAAGLPDAAAEALGPFGPGHPLNGKTLPVWDAVLAAQGVADRDARRVFWRTWRAWVDQVEGRYGDAVAQSARAVADAEAGGHAHLLADALNTLGVSLRHQRRVDEAEAAFQRAWTMATASGQAEEAVLAGRMLTRSALDRGDREEGVARARALVAFAESTASDARLAEAWHELARALGHTPECRRPLEDALAVFRRHERRQQELSCRFDLATLDRSEGHLDRAIAEYEALGAAMDSLGGAEAALARLAVAACWMDKRDWPQLERALRAARGRFGPGTRPTVVTAGHGLGMVAAAAAGDWARFDDELAGCAAGSGARVAEYAALAAELATSAGEPARAARARALAG